jgi:DHA1 family inner membrane transport protein
MLNPGAVLFLSLFAGQAAVLVLAPILPEVAGDFGVSTATAGQLRSLSGIAGGLAAVGLGVLARRLQVRELLVGGLALLALGSLASAIAPSFTMLAAAQVAIGAGVAAVLSAGVAAAAEWARPDQRTRVLSWALLGQPAAWVAGMPLVGFVAEHDWRLAWLVLPLASSALALLAVRLGRSDGETREPGDRPLPGSPWGEPDLVGWAIGELLAFAAWAGTLVYAGALFLESYGLPLATTGLILAVAASAYFPGALFARRFVESHARVLLVALGVLASVGIACFGTVRPAAWVSAAIFTSLVFIVGARTIAASAFGLRVAPRHRVAVMSIRAAATQFGYLLGAAIGGAALAVGGYAGMGAVLSALFALAIVPHVAAARSGASFSRGCGSEDMARHLPIKRASSRSPRRRAWPT